MWCEVDMVCSTYSNKSDLKQPSEVALTSIHIIGYYKRR